MTQFLDPDALEAVRVDERDAAWEEREPRFRLYFFGPGHGIAEDGSDAGWDVDTVDLVGGDVLDALRFADWHAEPGARIGLALVVSPPTVDARGLVWLLGDDLNTSKRDQRTLELFEQMHAAAAARARVPRTIAPNE